MKASRLQGSKRDAYDRVGYCCYDRNPKRAPAATAEPMTPATLGPMACMSRKLWRSYSRPRLLEIRALIGTALTPALPISGLSFLSDGRKRFISFTKHTPLIVAMAKAAAPMAKMNTVFSVRNSEACVLFSALGHSCALSPAGYHQPA